MEPEAVVLARTSTPRGELALRRRGDRFEIISNGMFLVDTSSGRSERALITEALTACPAPRPRVLIGGLGVGFTLDEAARHRSPAVIDVVEIEQTIIDWHRSHLSALSEQARQDPRTRLICADILAFLASTNRAYDVIALDIDNGPEWTLTARNESLYGEAGVELLRSALANGGVLAVWSAQPADSFHALLRDRFAVVQRHEIPAPVGNPDIVYIARTD